MRSFAIVAAFGMTTAGVGQPSFQGLGDLPGGAYFSDVEGVSADGTTITGFSENADGRVPFRWTRQDGMVQCRDYSGGPGLGDAWGVTGNGSRIVGFTPGGEGFHWSAASGMQIIGDLPGAPNNCRIDNISDDGSTIVGVGNWVDNWPDYTGQAVRWTDATGFVPMGWLEPEHDFSEAIGSNEDGSVIVGYSGKVNVDWEAWVWTESTGMQPLGWLPGGTWSLMMDTNPDGTVLVGQSNGNEGYVATRWTQSGGLESLGDLPGGGYALGVACSADGKTVVGLGDWNGAIGTAFIWREGMGMAAIKDVLENEYGLDLTGWELNSAFDISADGNVIAGGGTNPSGETEGWMVDLTADPCPADFNGDGTINTLDVLAFLNAFNAGC